MIGKTNNSRRYPGETNQHRPDLASARREEASERQKQYDDLTPAQKLEKLDIRFGVGKGATKERARLLRLVSHHKLETKNEQELLVSATIPDEIMAEIEALNSEDSSKKKLKAKDRRRAEKFAS